MTVQIPTEQLWGVAGALVVAGISTGFGLIKYFYMELKKRDKVAIDSLAVTVVDLQRKLDSFSGDLHTTRIAIANMEERIAAVVAQLRNSNAVVTEIKKLQGSFDKLFSRVEAKKMGEKPLGDGRTRLETKKGDPTGSSGK